MTQRADLGRGRYRGRGRETSQSDPPPAANPLAKYVTGSLLWSGALFALCILSGRWQAHLVADSASYLDYSWTSAQAMARHTRMPAYPAILDIAQAIMPSKMAGLQLMVFLQIVLQGTAVSLLMVELGNWGLSPRVAIAAAGAVAIGCPFWDNVSTIATDCAAMSWGVITATWVLRGWRIGFSTRLLVAVAASALLAISLRPAYLFLLPLTPLLLLFRSGDGMPTPWSRRWRDVAVWAPLPLFVLLGWCTFRYMAVGDFSLLPFGHQNMAAVTTQLLDNDELDRLPGRSGELAGEIARRRVSVAGGRGGREAGLGSISSDGLDLRRTGDPSLRAGSYMVLENRWDAMTYLVVIPAAIKVAGDDPIAQHRLLAELDRQIVRAYPERYAWWWLLAIRRGVWGSVANIVMHPIFLVVIVLAAGATTLFCIWPGRSAADGGVVDTAGGTRCSAPARRALTLIAVTYAASGLAFVALTSPTIGRFSDAAFVFIPSLAAMALVLKSQQLLENKSGVSGVWRGGASGRSTIDTSNIVHAWREIPTRLGVISSTWSSRRHRS